MAGNVSDTPPALLRVDNLSQQFNRKWIFQQVAFELTSGDRLLLSGPNGSGKSTLMRIIAGQLSPSKGTVTLRIAGKTVEPTRFYRHLSWAGPYFELFPDLTVMETVRMHFRFKTCLLPSANEVVTRLGFGTHASKAVKHLSSGMLQRLKSGLAILSESKILLLDEATSNMDDENAAALHELMEAYTGTRILIFASNKPSEFATFRKRLSLKPSV